MFGHSSCATHFAGDKGSQTNWLNNFVVVCIYECSILIIIIISFNTSKGKH